MLDERVLPSRQKATFEDLIGMAVLDGYHSALRIDAQNGEERR